MDKVKKGLGCISKFLRVISQGQVDTGLYFNGTKVYATVYTGIISLLIIILMKYLVILAVIDTFSKTYTETSVSQGHFSIDSYTIGDFIETLVPSIEVVSTDTDFCNTHNVTGYIVSGNTYHNLYVGCEKTANNTDFNQYNYTLTKVQTQEDQSLNDQVAFEIYVYCFHSGCDDSKFTTIHEFSLFSYSYNKEGTVIKERKKYQSSNIGEAVVYKTIPLLKQSSESVFDRWPSYDTKLYFQTEFDYPLNVSDYDQSFQLRINLLEYTDQWTMIQTQPRTVTYLLMQIGGYLGILMILSIFMGCFNGCMFKREITTKYLKNIESDSQPLKAEEVFSYDEFVKMKKFIDRLQKSPEFMRMLRDMSVVANDDAATEGEEEHQAFNESKVHNNESIN